MAQGRRSVDAGTANLIRGRLLKGGLGRRLMKLAGAEQGKDVPGSKVTPETIRGWLRTPTLTAKQQRAAKRVAHAEQQGTKPGKRGHAKARPEPAARIPDAASLIELYLLDDISANYLLFGMGPERVNYPEPGDDLGSRLREYLVAELRREHGEGMMRYALSLPEGSALLAEAIRHLAQPYHIWFRKTLPRRVGRALLPASDSSDAEAYR